MVPQTYTPAADETLGQFVDLLFQRLFFRPDDMPGVLTTFAHDVAPDAFIDVNGKTIPAPAFLEIIKGFHAGTVAALLAIEDLAVHAMDAAGRTGVVAQRTRFSVTSRTDSSVVEQESVTIVKVGEHEGRRVMTMLTEVQQ